MNFGGHEVVYGYDESKIIIIPVPYDETSTWMRGADRGPDAILSASVNLEFFDTETYTEAHLHGIHTVTPITVKDSPESLAEEVYTRVGTLLNEGKFPVIIGGNHTVPIGAFRAYAEKFSNLTILQLDAHADLRPEYEGSRLNHACAMARAGEYAPVIQVGIRSMSKDEIPYADRDRIFFSSDLYEDKSLWSKAEEKLTDNVYLTIDLDVFDPSLMPSTGTPEPGGPGYYDIMHFLRRVIGRHNLVGFDVVELCPSESNKAPDFVAAKVIYQILSYRFAKEKP